MKPLSALLAFCLAALLLGAAARSGSPEPLPYAAAGLTERGAAAHLLQRFTFGPRPGDLDRALAMGLERWLEAQLRAVLPDPALERRLEALRTSGLSAEELARQYPNPGRVLAMARRAGIVSPSDTALQDQQALRAKVRAYAAEQGYRPQRELTGELMAQKLLRARYSENQLQEVLTDFWYNHFHVSLRDNQARPHLLSYERDAIRPHVLGDFRSLLGATARHPAMLLYLDNAQSTAPDSAATTMAQRLARFENQKGLRGRVARRRIAQGRARAAQAKQRLEAEVPEPFRSRPGVNENYARELLELHTLGVEGGYTQADVENLARVLTGWSVMPQDERAERLARRLWRGRRLGFAQDGLFLFRADAHDARPKQVLGTSFPAGGGLEEGERVLDLLAAHPATARHLARKLAVRFVSDTPPEALVDKLAAVFTQSGGDLRAVVRSLAYSPHFWAEAARRSKIKSPFELALSAVRALDADVRQGRDLVRWIERMGQPLYAYAAPTGYPDRADAWINAGTLVNRMNFGMALATGGIRSLGFDLLALHEDREPATPAEALHTYAGLLLPEQDHAALIDRLLPLAQDPALPQKMAARAGAGEVPVPADPLARAVGVLLGSPDFQRR